MNKVHPLIHARSKAFDVELFVDSFLKSPLAKAMIERGEPLTFFVPIHRSDCAGWRGIDVTIAGVAKEPVATEMKALAEPERGNGHSGNVHSALKPGDFGVHSHPDTTKLLNHDPDKT